MDGDQRFTYRQFQERVNQLGHALLSLGVGEGDRVCILSRTTTPSAVEPYEGAATGVGGIVRDIFAMGARPIAILDSLRFGPLTEARSRYLFEGVVAGISVSQEQGCPGMGTSVTIVEG